MPSRPAPEQLNIDQEKHINGVTDLTFFHDHKSPQGTQYCLANLHPLTVFTFPFHTVCSYLKLTPSLLKPLSLVHDHVYIFLKNRNGLSALPHIPTSKSTTYQHPFTSSLPTLVPDPRPSHLLWVASLLPHPPASPIPYPAQSCN